jgi:hypothetical protein
MSEDERVALRDALFDGYCQECGGNRLPCHCIRDDRVERSATRQPRVSWSRDSRPPPSASGA